MRKYYVFIALLSIFALILVVIGFLIVGTPFSQRDIQLDTSRLTSFSAISTAITTYQEENNGTLPTDLSKLPINGGILSLNDPETNKPYDYKVISSQTYELCTTFSTDSSKTNTTPTYSYYAVKTDHPKGYACITYKGQDYNNYIYNNPTPIPPQPVTPVTDIKILSPKLNEVLCMGSSYQIQYEATTDIEGIGFDIKGPASFMTQISTDFSPVKNQPAPGLTGYNKGSYAWTVGQTISKVGLNPGFGYQLEVIASTGGSSDKFFYSDLFTISNSCNSSTTGTKTTQ